MTNDIVMASKKKDCVPQNVTEKKTQKFGLKHFLIC